MTIGKHDLVADSESMPAALIDVKSVAKLLGDCSIRHIYRLCDAGKMPRPIKLGHLVRWRRAEVVAWIEQGCPAVTGPKEVVK